MNTRFLIAASVLAIMAGAPAFAETSANANAEVKAEAPSLSKDAKREWNNIKQDASEATDKTAEAAEDVYEDIKATVIGEETTTTSSTVTIDSRATASGMIGQPVLNTKGEKIATVQDIILDANGNATTVVLADGGFMGIGTKLAAFDYNLVSLRQKDGDVIMPISEETLDKVAPFSYELKDAEKDAKVRVIPADGISVARLLEGQILNAKKENVAEIDNISFRDGEASQIIIGFDKTLGLGGEKAAMSYNSANVIREKNDLDVQLTANQAVNFENFKKTATN
ncbi:MAG: PRC-barrel domain-containing protein [Alphaproteobacteria bacterium]